MTPIRYLLALGTAAFVVVPTPVAGQDPEPPPALALQDSTLVDRVAAIVGDSVILMTELQQQVIAFREQGRNPDPRQVLAEMVDHLLIIQAAARDTTMVIPEAELDARLEEAVRTIRSRFPNDAAFQSALEERGLTLSSYRSLQREQLRTQLLRDIYMQRQLRNAPPAAVTEAEMRAVFDEQQGNIQEQRPELLTLQQVLVPVRATDDAWARARTVADSLLEELRGGADFAELAREHSDDPGSAAEGGDMGWFRRGQMVRRFETVAFQLPPGSLSEPVRTEYGWHIILTERVRAGEVKARHILIQPEITEADRQAARDRARDVAEAARGGADLEALAEATADRAHPEEYDEVVRSRQELARMEAPGYADNLADAGEGEVVGPFRTRNVNGEYFAVIRVEDIREAGEYTFEDLREQIRSGLVEQKRLERIMERLRAGTYIDIRM